MVKPVASMAIPGYVWMAYRNMIGQVILTVQPDQTSMGFSNLTSSPAVSTIITLTINHNRDVIGYGMDNSSVNSLSSESPCPQMKPKHMLNGG